MAEIERDIEGEEEEIGLDSLVPRRSNNKHNHTHAHTVFDSQQGPIDIYGPPVEIFEAEEHDVDQGEDLNGRKTQGSETLNGFSKMEVQFAENIADSIVEDDSTPKSSLETDLESLEIQKDESTGIYSSNGTAKTSNGNHSVAVNGHGNGTIRLDESEEALEEFNEDSLDVDVERVLKKQETHDLFCPNCNSCITKRVILRRRKRKIQEISPSEEIVIPEPPPQELVNEPEIVEDTSCDAVRCLSCFSIFIPISWKGLGWDPPQLPTSDTGTSVPGADPGTGEDQHLGLGVDTVEEKSPVDSQPELYPEQEQETSMAVAPDTQLPPTKVDSMTLPAENTLPMKLEADGVNNISGTEISENKVTVGEQEELAIQIDKTEAQVVVSRTIISQKDVENVDPEKRVDLSVVQQQDQTVITVKSPTDTCAETVSRLPAGSDISAALSATPAAVAATDGGDPQIDIIKSMVYGGMLEAIASLSVVTSAAGADAKTLNIVALGAANMLGGLFILAHNLRVLKHETSEERYEEVLGRPGHFTLHSVVAVLSYLVFGLLPPVIYGFTFRESDNRDYKLIAVTVASLISIIILALAKSYARRPPIPKAYMKTLVYYLSLWIMVCGVSYAAGDLFDLLLQKLGWFESSSSVAMPLPVGEFRSVKMPWASS